MIREKYLAVLQAEDEAFRDAMQRAVWKREMAEYRSQTNILHEMCQNDKSSGMYA